MSLNIHYTITVTTCFFCCFRQSQFLGFQELACPSRSLLLAMSR